MRGIDHAKVRGKDPFDALVWIANELPKHGMHLHAGDFVVTGTVCVPPPYPSWG